MPTLREALDEAQAFLIPAWKAGNNGPSWLRNQSTASDPQKGVLRRDLALLHQIHEADVSSQDQTKVPISEGEYDEDSRKTLYGLLDLLAVRGILPSLSPGVAITRRPKSVLKGLNKPAESEHALQPDVGLLSEIIDGLAKFLQNAQIGLAPLVRERVLVDVLAGAGELAFSPKSNRAFNAKYEEIFTKLVQETPTASALPLLTYLIQPSTPQWLKIHLSKQLAIIPLRPRGVRYTIEFIASSYPPPPQPAAEPGREVDTRGPPLPLDALLQASKLLSSVPSGMSADAYFKALAPQLLAMLDGNDGPEFSKASALVISTVLGQRALGTPDAIGWKLFAEPMISSISPPAKGKEGASTTSSAAMGSTIVSERDLKRAMARLTALLTARPNIGLNKRLLSRLMLPLWALLAYSKSRPLDRSWRDTTWGLLEIYFRLGANVEQLDSLAANLLFDGPAAWIFAPGSEGGIEIRRREKSPAEDNILERMGKVETRLSAYQELLESGAIEDQDIGELFVRLTRKWLLPQTATASKGPSLRSPEEDDPLQSLINARLVMSILEKFKDKLAADPGNMIQIVKQLLDEWVEAEKANKKRKRDLEKATYAGLSNIVQHENAPAVGGTDEQTYTPLVDSNELLPIALSFLSTIVSAPNFKTTKQVSETLSTIIPPLQLVSRAQSLPESVPQTADNLITQISSILNIPVPKTAAPAEAPSDADRKTLNAALNELIDPAPPIRAMGLSTIRDLTNKRSPVIDVPTITLLLIRDLLTDKEEYVYQHCMRTLAALTQRDPPLVSNLLVDAFADPNENAVGDGGLEGRLRVAETLGRVVADLSDDSAAALDPRSAATWRPLVQRIASATLTVSSRRGQRAKDLAARKRAAALGRKKQREAEKEWGGSVPEMPSLLNITGDGGDEEPETEQDRADAALLESIIAKWSDTGLQEDVRLRTSGLSILGSLLERPATLALLAPDAVRSGVDIALGALSLETEASFAILRRAAAMVIMSLLRGMDAGLEAGAEVAKGVERIVGPAVGAERWAEIGRVMEWVRDGDEDVVAKGHAGAVVEGLEALRVKRAVGVKADGTAVDQGGVRLGLEGKLRGLNVGPERQVGEESAERERPKIEEVE
ncbi:uncharacterized protein K452DRAFT_356162 [Aplosporella prunicola CBS 121167]|uniref:RNA polymerase II assembly factor Rtp1 C-terminal domain-containing protein n=1 Tax=Aplosporella prunicola CBS 121167 TaxID=1176127 RepID=A0A6A6BR59_9PEZI|nr:uncharacterized protein K452DRAFT_356162 [Aplosporella prunicola CBS 121167]KAF2145785.1 hypothetical protein K452DRAFT_356162 [Aplosporella prunicola CBS 121167]